MRSAGCAPSGGEVTDRMCSTGLGTCGRSWTSTPRTTTTIARTGQEPAATGLRRHHNGPVTGLATAWIRRRNVLGELIHEYERAV